MACIGQLAAGIAHEINNPVGYVYSNLSVLQDYTYDLLQGIATLDRVRVIAGENSDIGKLIEHIKKDSDLDFICQDTPALVHESKNGIDKVRSIVQLNAA